MATFREIVTKAVIGKGKKKFTDNLSLETTNAPTTVLGCWVINHNYQGTKNNNIILIKGSYDINIWYSYDNDTKTEVLRNTHNYQEQVTIEGSSSDTNNEEIIIRSLMGPSCIKAEITNNKINATVEKTLGIELVGDTKVKISAIDDSKEEWEEINDSDEVIDELIDNEVNEEYLGPDLIGE